MKNLVTLIAFIIAPLIAFGQGSSCADMDPICTDVGASFTAGTGSNSESGNNYGCLATQPNPSWYYLEISNNGDVDMSLTADEDIDYAIWGPFADLANAQGNCGSLPSPIDCSYSSTNIESPSISNAVVGDVYVLLITNYEDIIQDITLTQTGGTGATDCSIVTDPPCFMNNFEATISACDALSDTYSVTGLVEFDDPPTTGDLIVEDCNGNQTIVASAPFAVNGSGAGSENYTLNGSNADGGACDVTAFFSADPTCTLNLTYTAPICLCNLSYLEISISACDDATGTFNVTGFADFESAPLTGTLTFTDCNGNTDVYFAPFTSGQTFSLNNIASDGTTNCTVTASFSADPACNLESPSYNFPECVIGPNCPVDAGSFTGSITGNTTNQTELCFGDQFVLTPNGGYVPPDDIGGDVLADGTPFTYNPGMWFLIYDCPPTLQAPDDIFVDPCLLGVWESGTPLGPWVVDNVFGDNTTYFFVPVTFYDYEVGVYSYYTAGTLCYDTGPAYEITFLSPIIATPVDDCFTGTSDVTLSGGAPALNGSDFTVVPGSLLPANAAFDNTTAGEGGVITISGLLDGDNYSFDVIDENNCPVTVTGTFQGLEDATFTYDFKYCANDPDPLPTITGVAGGNFTVTPAVGMSLNASTGLIDLSETTPGVYTIEYVSPAADCWGTETFTIVINPQPLVTATEDSPICDDGVSTINLGETGGEATSWSWSTTGGATITDATLQNQVISDATDGETFTVSVEDVNTGCINSDQVSVTVNPQDDPTFTTTDYCFGLANAAAVTGTPGGTFAFNPAVADGATINVGTGEITGGVATTTYQIEYTTNGTCPLSLIVPVTVNPLPIIATTDETICAGGSIDITADGAGTGTYSWSPGTELNATTGATVTSTPTADISYTVTGTDANGCVNVATSNITVSGNAPINAGTDVEICDGESTTLLATGGLTYTWDNGLGDGDTHIVTPAVTTTYIVNGIDASGCSGTDEVIVTVNTLPFVSAGPDQVECEGVDITLSGSGATSYVWDNGVTDGVIFTQAPGTVTYNVTGTDANGCEATDEVDVTINALPVVDAGADQTICEGEDVTLTATGANTYVWDNGVTDGVIFTQAPGTVTYNVTGTDANGCENTDQVDVIVNPLPIVDAGLDQTECDGTSITLVGSGATSYSWDNGVVDGVSFTPGLGTVTYTVTGTDANSCVNTDQVDVVVNPNPTPLINGADEYCIGTSTVLSTANPYSTYLWSTTDVTPTSTVTVADNPISVTVTNTFGCSGTSADFTVIENTVINYNSTETICQGESILIHGISQTVAGIYSQTFILPTGCDSVSNVTLVVNPLPVVDAGLDQTLCIGGGVTLTVVGADTYVWDNAITNGVQFTPSVGAITYTVTGTDLNGCVNTDQVDVTVNPLPTVNADFDQVICDGDLVTLEGSGPDTYVWDNGVLDGVAFAPAVGTITYTVIGTDLNGCENSDQVDVTVNALPNVLAGLDDEICFGEVVTLSATGAANYSWDNGVVDGVSFTPSVGTVTYTVTGTDANSCVNSDQVTVVVNDLPVVLAGPDQVLCDGDMIALTGIGASTYTWDNGVSNGVQFTPLVGSTTYTVTGVDVNGCENTDQVIVTTNALPNVNAGADQELCVGSLVTLNGIGADTYVWDNGVTNGNSFTPLVGTVMYTVTGTDANGCENTDQVIVVINPLPIVNAGNDIEICENEDIVLTATGANTYVWNNGVTNGVSFSPIAGNYVVVGTDINGCIGTDDLNITIQSNPTASFIPFFEECEPFTGMFINNSQTTGNFSNCVWTINNGATLTGCADTIYYTFPEAGTYDVTLTTTTDLGCSSSLTLTDIVSLQEGPVASFNMESADVSTLSTEVQFNNTSTGAVGYEWSFGDETANSTLVNPNHEFPSDGDASYLVTLVAISNLGCTDTTTAVVNVEEELIFYVPNTFTPDHDDFNETFKPVFTSGFDPFDYQLIIYNRWGEVVFESLNAEIGWDGSYAKKFEVQDGTYTWKIVFKTSANDERKAIHGHVNIIR